MGQCVPDGRFPVRMQPEVIVNLFQWVRRCAGSHVHRTEQQRRGTNHTGCRGTKGRGDQRQVRAHCSDAAAIHLGPAAQVLEPPKAVGDYPPVDKRGRIVYPVRQHPREGCRIGLIGLPLSPGTDGEGHALSALAVGRALGHQVHHAAVTGQEIPGRKGPLTPGNAQVAKDPVGSDGCQTDAIGGGEVGTAQGDFLDFGCGRNSLQLVQD